MCARSSMTHGMYSAGGGGTACNRKVSSRFPATGGQRQLQGRARSAKAISVERRAPRARGHAGTRAPWGGVEEGRARARLGPQA